MRRIKNVLKLHDYLFPLSASTGSSFAALLAGSKPNMIPDINATIRETYEAHRRQKIKIWECNFQ